MPPEMRVATVPFIKLLLIRLMKKKINIILVLVVILLWSTVVWRSVKNFLVQPTNTENTIAYEQVNLNKINKDTFELEKLNSDPFLKKSIIVGSNSLESTNGIKPINKQKKVPLPSLRKSDIKKVELSEILKIQYVGYLKSTNQIVETAIVRINGNIKSMIVGKKYDGIIVKKVFKDSIQVMCLNRTIFIKRL